MAHSAPLQGFFFPLFLASPVPCVFFLFAYLDYLFRCVASAFIGVPASGKEGKKTGAPVGGGVVRWSSGRDSYISVRYTETFSSLDDTQSCIPHKEEEETWNGRWGRSLAPVGGVLKSRPYLSRTKLGAQPKGRLAHPWAHPTHTQNPPLLFALDRTRWNTPKKKKISFLLLLPFLLPSIKKCITSFFFLAVVSLTGRSGALLSLRPAVCLHAQLYPPVGTLELSPSRHIVVTT